jgi:uncharacterized protein (TIGR03790 family)
MVEQGVGGTHDETPYRMKWCIRCVTYFFAAASFIPSRSVFASGYQDVAVVVNTNSQVSLDIGNYFQTARGIPQTNIIRVNTTTDETVNDSVFASLRHQIESYLRTNNLVDSINYIVTTKGVPLRVDRGDLGGPGSTSASVESELMCVLGPDSAQIGNGGGCLSPYFAQTAHFSRRAFGIYLITRLDGYSLQDVERLIDKSGPGVLLNSASPFILDEDPLWAHVYDFLNANLAKARAVLAGNGALAILDTGTVFMTHESGVAGYASWGSNDHSAVLYSNNGSPHNTWMPGAIAETYVSTSARSFMTATTYGQSLVADLIQEGVSGARGYVFEPYTSAMTDVSILFGRYTSGYNLAESYFSASHYLSWMDVVVGDPKTSIVLSSLAALPVQLSSFEALPVDYRSVRVDWTTPSETNCYGFIVERRTAATGTFSGNPASFTYGAGTSAATHSYSWLDSGIPPGAYEYRLNQSDLDGTVHYSGALAVTLTLTDAQREQASVTTAPGLRQNFPNPFNPATSITYSLSRNSHVTLTIYDVVGREVARLVDRQQGPGSYTAAWEAHAAASGVYICRLQAEGRTWEKKVVYLK